MDGYDGPSFLKEGQKEATTERSAMNKKDGSSLKSRNPYKLPEHTSQSTFLERNRTSTPFRMHSVASSYFNSHKKHPPIQQDYSHFKKSLKREETSFLLFEAFLSEKGESIWESLSENQEEMLEMPFSEKMGKNKEESKKKNQVPHPRKRLSRSLAGIIESEKTSAERTRNMSSLFIHPDKL